MKCKEVMEQLQSRWPQQYALEWDNVGLLVGDPEAEVHHIFVALDVTDHALQQAIDAGADMMITHHPLLFNGIKKITADHFIGRRIMKMINHGINYYAMHTNFDVTGMANLNASSLDLEFPTILDVTYEDEEHREGIGRVGGLHQSMTLKEFGVYAKEHLQLEMVRVYGDPDAVIERVAISSGSGKNMVDAAIRAGAQVLVTGDIDYHTGIDAVAKGLMMVDGGHYGTEMIFIDYMEETLREIFADLTITSAVVEQPFMLI